jgi:hypothetical protein
LVAWTDAVLTKSVQFKAGVALPLIWTVRWCPAPRAGTFTGSAVIFETSTSGSSVVTCTARDERNDATDWSSTTTPVASRDPTFRTSIEYVTGVVCFGRATVGVTDLAISSTVPGWNGQFR